MKCRMKCRMKCQLKCRIECVYCLNQLLQMKALSLIRVFRPTAYVAPTTFTATARLSVRLYALNFGDEEFEEEDDRKEVVPNVGNDDDTQREFLLETTGVGPEVYAKLAPILENLVTKFAIDTLSYYMTEFRDDVTKTWMRSFKNYEEDGFSAVSWVEYLEEMIDTDEVFIKTRMVAPQAYILGNQTLLDELKARNDPSGSRIRIELMQKLEPRKVAHQILTVREGIGKEIIADLKSVRVDNFEAKRYATNYITVGAAEAEKKRRPTRMTNEGESTPLREKNHLEILTLIMNLALDLVRSELDADKSASSSATIEYLNEFVLNLTESSIKSDLYERFEDDRKQARTLLETLYFRSISEGATVTRGDVSVNIRRLSQQIMDKRASIAFDMQKILNELASYSRPFYKTIKDKGGFAKFDRSKPDFKVVDLDLEEKQIAAAEEAKQRRLAEELQQMQQQAEIEATIAAVSSGKLVADENTEHNKSLMRNLPEEELKRDLDDFGQSGPMLM